MLVRLALLAVSLVVAAAASANPLIGVWKSDRELALLEIGKLATLTLEQHELLPTSDLVGRAVAICGDREIEFRLAERATRLSHRIVATGSDFVEVEYDGEQAAEPVRKRLLLKGGLLHVPVEDPGFHEVFRRIDVPAAPSP